MVITLTVSATEATTFKGASIITYFYFHVVAAPHFVLFFSAPAIAHTISVAIKPYRGFARHIIFLTKSISNNPKKVIWKVMSW
jgi:hypothetical protein